MRHLPPGSRFSQKGCAPTPTSRLEKGIARWTRGSGQKLLKWTGDPKTASTSESREEDPNIVGPPVVQVSFEPVSAKNECLSYVAAMFAVKVT